MVDPSAAEKPAEPDGQSDPLAAFDAVAAKFAETRASIGAVIFGQDDVIDLSMATLAAGGHALLVGAPGLAKTLLLTSIAQAMGLSAKRIQFTPDLMPADILGAEVLEETPDGKRAFRFVRGPVFCQLLMADEINRASPRTQSALLQAMQEHHVTVAGERHDLPAPFHVLATQNPIEQEGTYPLPEAQLDRFLMQIDVGYPDREAERRMLSATTGASVSSVSPVLTPSDLQEGQRLVRNMPIGDQIVDAILTLVRSARPQAGADKPDRSALAAKVDAYVAWGPGPRASQALTLATKAAAMIDGRYAPSLDDVRRLARPVLKHRMALNFTARAEGEQLEALIDALIDEATAG